MEDQELLGVEARHSCDLENPHWVFSRSEAKMKRLSRVRLSQRRSRFDQPPPYPEASGGAALSELAHVRLDDYGRQQRFHSPASMVSACPMVGVLWHQRSAVGELWRNDVAGTRVRWEGRHAAIRPSTPSYPRPPFLRVSGLAFLSTKNRSLRPRKSPRDGRSKSTSGWMNINRPICQFHLPAASRSSLRKGTLPIPFCKKALTLGTPHTKNPVDFAHDMLYYCYTWTDKNTSVAVPPWVRKRSPAVRGSRARRRFPMEKSYA